MACEGLARVDLHCSFEYSHCTPLNFEQRLVIVEGSGLRWRRTIHSEVGVFS